MRSLHRNLAMPLGICLLGALPVTRAQDIAVVGGTVHVGSGQVIADGVVVIRGGKVIAVGPAASTPVPAGVPELPARGKHVTPGFIDLHTRLFLAEEDLRDLGAVEARSVADALDLLDGPWRSVRAGGVTTVGVAPGTSQIAGGLGAVIKLGRAPAILERASHYLVALGVSGERSTSAERLEQYHRLRGLFVAAREYRKAWDEHWKAVEKYNQALKQPAPAPKPAEPPKEGQSPSPAPAPTPAPAAPEKPKPPRAPAVDIGREALARALDKKLPVLIEAHRPDDLRYALELRHELGLDATILGATQAAGMVEKLAASGTTVVVEPVILDRWALEYRGHDEGTARALHAGKVPLGIASPGAAGRASAQLRLQAIAAVRGGLEAEAALAAITSVPARVLGLGTRLGTLEAGKDGDLVIFSGDPLDARSRVERVIVDGEVTAIDPPAAVAVARPPRNVAAPTAAPPPSGRTTVFRGATIVVPSAMGVTVHRTARLIVSGGKVVAVDPGDGVAVDGPRDEIDLGGRWILPGFIDAASHAGIAGETDDISLSIAEDLRVIDGFDPWDPELQLHLARGTLYAALVPGGANLVGGKASLVKLAPGRVPIPIVAAAAAVRVSLAPALSLPRFPTAPSGVWQAFASWVESGGPARAAPGAPALIEVASRSMAERALGLLDGKASGVALIDGGLPAEGWEALRVTRTVILVPPGLGDGPERLRAAAVVARTAPIAFGTRGSRRDLLLGAVLSMQAGLSQEDALLGLTLWPAELYRAGGRIAALEPGADADFVVWTDDPLSLRGRVERVYIDGVEIPTGGGRAPER